MADCLAFLMTNVLGYPRFGGQGGDWGSFIAARLWYAYPDRLSGIHLSFLPLRRIFRTGRRAHPGRGAPSSGTRAFPWRRSRLPSHSGHAPADPGLRPDRLSRGAGCVDNREVPGLVGLRGRSRVRHLAGDLLANISLYWSTGAISSSVGSHHARAYGSWPVPMGKTADVPTAYAAFPQEILHPPRSLAARTVTDIRRWMSFDRGGHFPALEQPDVFATDIRAFLRLCRNGQ